MDIMTGMVIMSIVIAMVFYLFTASNKQAYEYGDVRAELNEFLLMKADLKLQIDRAETVIAIPNGFRLSNEEQTIDYIKSDTYLIRKLDLNVDTLNSRLTKLNIQTSDNFMEMELIARIDLEIDIQGQILSCHLNKDYGIREKINMQLIDGI